MLDVDTEALACWSTSQGQVFRTQMNEVSHSFKPHFWDIFDEPFLLTSADVT